MSKVKAINTLMSGGVIVMPTDTVYGICARALDKKAVSKLYKIKQRNTKPGTLIACSLDQLVNLGIKRRYLKPVEYLWPGAISVILPVDDSLGYLDQSVGTLAVRVVADKRLVDILRVTGPLLTSSANLPGHMPAEDIVQAKGYFGDKIDYYFDGGEIRAHSPSTIIRVVDDVIEVLREGAVKIDERGEII